jgi:hypothetical protein
LWRVRQMSVRPFVTLLDVDSQCKVFYLVSEGGTAKRQVRGLALTTSPK